MLEENVDIAAVSDRWLMIAAGAGLMPVLWLSAVAMGCKSEHNVSRRNSTVSASDIEIGAGAQTPVFRVACADVGVLTGRNALTRLRAAGDCACRMTKRH